MKQRIGGLLAIALGAVLIGTGIQSGSAGVIGGPPPDCGAAIVGSIANTCPTGTITVDEITTPTPGQPGDPTVPVGGWSMTLTSSNCLTAEGSVPVDIPFTVHEGSSRTIMALFIYTNSLASTQCDYTLTESAVTGFSTSYSLASPFHISFDGTRTGSSVTVDVTNSFVRTPPTTSAAPSTPASTPATSASSPTLADTGPHTRLGVSLYIGVALVLLGIGMVFGGSRRRRGRRV